MTAFVALILKEVDRNNTNNYKPISLTSICYTLCEDVIDKSIMHHLEDHGLLTDSQHSFRTTHTYETQLLQLVVEFLQVVANGKPYDLAIMDFNKAFYVVPHKRLINKLQDYGIKGPCLDLIKDFLKNRSQRIVVDGKCSDDAAVTFKVPQGSVLGPILLLAFINYMPQHVKSKCQCFADDSII